MGIRIKALQAEHLGLNASSILGELTWVLLGLSSLSREGSYHLHLLGEGRMKWSQPFKVLDAVPCQKKCSAAETMITMIKSLVCKKMSAWMILYSIKGKGNRTRKASCVCFHYIKSARYSDIWITLSHMHMFPLWGLLWMHLWKSSGMVPSLAGFAFQACCKAK